MDNAAVFSKSGGRRRTVANKIRKRILSGHYPIGGQLPTFDNLVEEFGVSRATMQLTIRQLKEEGFVRSVHRSGLFVSDTAPHLHRFGLLFASSAGDEAWTRFMAALLAEAPVVARSRNGTNIVPFNDIDEGKDTSERRRLLADAAIHRLAGMIITHGTAFVIRQPEVVQSEIPCVAINHSEAQAFGVPTINTDDLMFHRKALAWLAERGRKRVAVLAMRQSVGITAQDCANAGLTTRPHWICPIGSEFGGQTQAVVRLLLDYPPAERPDSLIVATDHLVEEALGTLHAAGIAIGRDIDVVAHCNWPWPVESPLPIARLGFHSHDFLNTALDLIGMIRQGKTPPSCTRIPALFEHEF